MLLSIYVGHPSEIRIEFDGKSIVLDKLLIDPKNPYPSIRMIVLLLSKISVGKLILMVQFASRGTGILNSSSNGVIS